MYLLLLLLLYLLLSVINTIDLLSYRKHTYVRHDAFPTVINPHSNLSTRPGMSALFSFNKRAYRARNKVIRGASHKLGKVMIVMRTAIAISRIKSGCNFKRALQDEIFS